MLTEGASSPTLSNFISAPTAFSYHMPSLTCLSYLFPNSPYELLKYSVLLKSYLMPLILGDDLDSHLAYFKKEIINCDLPSALGFACKPWSANTSILNLNLGSQRRSFPFSSRRFTLQSFVCIPSLWDGVLCKGKYCFIDLESQLTQHNA